MKYNEIEQLDDYIKWKSDFELGIPVIDSQHKTLVEMCNNLYQNLMKNKDKENWQANLTDALKMCANYVQTHFKDEEKLMLAVNYAEYESHKKRHDDFTKEVLKTVNSFASLHVIDAIKFVKFLYDWILSHIAHEDKLYVKPIKDYITNKGNS